MQRFESDVQFKCPNCSGIVRTTVEVPEPDWSAAEEMSDLTSDDETVVVCPECETEFLAHVFSSPSECTIKLNDHPLTNVVADTAFFSPDDEWLNYEPPDDPHSIFTASYLQAGKLLDDHGGDGDHLINRMVFAHRITALEAYLADTLINAVRADHRAFSRLLTRDTELAKEKFTLAQIDADPDLVKAKVLSYLRSVMWHNLPKVNALYAIALGKDLFALLGEKDKAELFKAIEHRHDCVHRNGFDKDGTKLDVFTKEYIVQIGNVITSLVGQIEEAPF
jgi:hypothetical protein